jgi:repressor LexA
MNNGEIETKCWGSARHLFDGPVSVSLLRVEDGDLVIAERTETARDGQIVIAQIDGEFTMKYLRKTGSKMWLEPANKNFKPMYPEHDLKVVAIIRGVVRKY